MCVSNQACYGHTEGAAGLAGAMTAAALCCDASAPPVTTLRHLNPYMAAAASDWQARQGLQAELPRQAASGPALVRHCIYAHAVHHMVLTGVHGADSAASPGRQHARGWH